MYTKVSSRQLILLGTIYILDATIISLPAQTIQYAKQHVWVSHLIVTLLLLVVIWLLSKVLDRFPKKDLFDAMISRYPLIGRVLTLLFILFFFIILARDIRSVTDFINVALLQQTPLWILATIFVFCLVMVARGGTEILARMTEFFSPTLIFVILLMPFILVKEFDPAFLMPYFEFDWKGILIGSWFLLPYMGEILAVFFLCNHVHFKFDIAAKALLGGIFLFTILTMCILLTVGPQLTPRLQYPTYELVRELRVTDFLDRFELPLVGIWLPTLTVKIAASLYIISHGVHRIFPSVPSKFLMIPFGFLGYVCSFWFFRDAIQLFHFNRTWPIVSIVILLVIPPILYLFLRPKKVERCSEMVDEEA